MVAEAARRCGLELLALPSWRVADGRALLDALALVRVEHDLYRDRTAVVDEVLARHPDDWDNDVVVDEIAAAIDIPPAQVVAFVKASVPEWHIAALDWVCGLPGWPT
jgi:hypothetical protein